MEGDHIVVETVVVKVEPLWGDESMSEALQSTLYAEHDIKQEQVDINELLQRPPKDTAQTSRQMKYEQEAIVDPLETSEPWTTVYEYEIKQESVISETPQSPVPQAAVNCEFKQEAGAPSTSSRIFPAPCATKRKGSKSRNLHSCHICQKQFTHLSNVQRHQVIHTGKKPYSCNICKKKFTQLISLKTHKAIHTGIKPYNCKTCKKEFTQLTNLRSHELTHTGVKPHSCDVCGKKFTRSDSLKTHKLIHTGVKPYSCKVCTKEFIKSGALRIHKRTHTGQPPYPCDMCELRFTLKGNLVRHKATHAWDSDTEPTDS